MLYAVVRHRRCSVSIRGRSGSGYCSLHVPKRRERRRTPGAEGTDKNGARLMVRERAPSCLSHYCDRGTLPDILAQVSNSII